MSEKTYVLRRFSSPDFPIYLAIKMGRKYLFTPIASFLIAISINLLGRFCGPTCFRNAIVSQSGVSKLNSEFLSNGKKVLFYSTASSDSGSQRITMTDHSKNQQALESIQFLFNFVDRGNVVVVDDKIGLFSQDKTLIPRRYADGFVIRQSLPSGWYLLMLFSTALAFLGVFVVDLFAKANSGAFYEAARSLFLGVGAFMIGNFLIKGFEEDVKDLLGWQGRISEMDIVASLRQDCYSLREEFNSISEKKSESGFIEKQALQKRALVLDAQIKELRMIVVSKSVIATLDEADQCIKEAKNFRRDTSALSVLGDL